MLSDIEEGVYHYQAFDGGPAEGVKAKSALKPKNN